MKILLISSNIAKTPYPVYPLGLSMVASALMAAGHEVRQSDILIHADTLDALAEEIRRFNPELIGISIRNIDNVNLMNEQYYIDVVKDMVRRIKGVSAANIVLGGAGFSLMPELIMQETGADYGVVGEGESLMIELADGIAAGKPMQERLLGPRNSLADKDIPSAAYDDRLMKFYLHSGNMASIQTKRGCTCNCVYCSYPLLEGRMIRMRDPAAVVDDIEMLVNEHNTGYLFFVDSVFNDTEGVYLEVIKEMLRRGVTVPWTGFFQPHGLNDENMAMMRETGLVAAEIGSDAATDATLQRLGKRFTFRDIIRDNELFVKYGVATSHYFMFGGPGETEDTVREGIENIKNLTKCVSFIFMGIRILPDTSLARLALKEKVLSPDEYMLKPIYYISPAIRREWLEETLTLAFADVRHCIFPPDAFDGLVSVLHKMGCAGTLWDRIVPGKQGAKKRRINAA
jgi:lipid biosynthesis B12-binding/radical SAM protein